MWSSFLRALLLSAFTTPAFGYLSPGTQFGVSGKNATFDYVVVGGGTAGLAMAHRLSENGTFSVGVVEAGGDYTVDYGNSSSVPALGRAYDSASIEGLNDFLPVDWGIATTPQEALNGEKFHFVRGRTLGGCSALNNVVYQRGTTGSYQKWADDVGDQSYTFENLLPFFKKSVNYTSDSPGRPENASVPAVDSNAYSSKQGLLHVSYVKFPLPISSWTKKAFNALGFKELNDFVSGKLIGHQYTPHTIDPTTQTRVSSFVAFMQNTPATSNMNVYTRTLAKKIIFDDQKRAIGVDVSTYGQPYHLSARREVILSAGAFHSPQLLMVSGIGPRSTLESLNISVIQDLPGVGSNMWDHIHFSPIYQANLIGIGALNDPRYQQESLANYTNLKPSIYSSPGFDYIGWEKLPDVYREGFSNQTKADLAQFPSDWPEIEYIVTDVTNKTDGNSNAYFSVGPGLVSPLSRGNVTIKSANTEDLPLVNPNWLSNNTDQEVALASFKRAREIANSSPMKDIIIGNETSPGFEKVQTDDEILAFLKANVILIYHPSCTNKMGKADDPMAVIDTKARVYGVSNLRVVDASSFALLPPGHPQATVYALAEKIAHDILNE